MIPRANSAGSPAAGLRTETLPPLGSRAPIQFSKLELTFGETVTLQGSRSSLQFSKMQRLPFHSDDRERGSKNVQQIWTREPELEIASIPRPDGRARLGAHPLPLPLRPRGRGDACVREACGGVRKRSIALAGVREVSRSGRSFGITPKITAGRLQVITPTHYAPRYVVETLSLQA